MKGFHPRRRSNSSANEELEPAGRKMALSFELRCRLFATYIVRIPLASSLIKFLHLCRHIRIEPYPEGDLIAFENPYC